MNAPDAAPPSRVLIAAESIVDHDVLTVLLEHAGYDVISVTDGREAMATLRGHAFDLAILDHDMPNLDDVAALVELRETVPHLPVIVCAGALTSEQKARYRELGIHDILPKPVNPHAVRDHIAHRLPRLAAADGTTSPFRDLHATSDAPVPTPLAAGPSHFSHRLQTELRRMREFRSVAILEGALGSGRFELALGLAPAADVHKFVCHATDFSPAHLQALLQTALADSHLVYLVLLEADQLDAAHQTYLCDLVHGQVHSPLAALSKRLRLVLCAQRSLCDLHYNELLLTRAATATLELPVFTDRWMDWAHIARAILRRVGNGRASFDDEAIRWIQRQKWQGLYMQFHRTIELAKRHAGLSPLVTAAHLDAALAAETTFDRPLFHDLLYHVHSGHHA